VVLTTATEPWGLKLFLYSHRVGVEGMGETKLVDGSVAGGEGGSGKKEGELEKIKRLLGVRGCTYTDVRTPIYIP